jgi:MICOS complex subunit MIC10
MFRMPEKMPEKRPEVHIDEKWDHVINVMFSRTVMGVLGGVGVGFLLFRGGQARYATTAFGAGIGVGSAFQLCNVEFKDLMLPK